MRIGDWRAWHVFVHNPVASEEVLVRCLGSEIASLSQEFDELKWFFIRYWENGPHLRIRLCNAQDTAFSRLGEKLSEAASSAAERTPSTISSFPEDMPVDGWHSSANAAPWFDEGAVLEVAYEPEIRRYGGSVAIDLAHKVFQSSSKIAIPIVGQTLGDMSRRQSVGLELTATAIGVLASDREEFTLFAQSMSEGWKGFLTDPDGATAQIDAIHNAASDRIRAWINNALDSESSELSKVATLWRTLLVNYFDALRDLYNQGLLISPLTGVRPKDESELSDALHNILFSQIHMMNNRLGLTPANEYIFANAFIKAS
ncbi:thiopeptide-type bacteriocin biosynthesis protein [Erythrobacter crassostreae]|uniref:Thiopeptide-type bacteriocin biosynthesis protein n=1 Tax=Erythrobacter crassostreae TaxID=2828328 RepID=A0A9X1F572_9SPHN|nr:thiopeptide-type bacteriocin biosynthesis protein [Erythrobacter crassostrea]MBV7260309.1 thiopeptide-type bacteriocin biosynthesis protein [Erythrobacter crassostrea]